jgi:serine/threonine-protein kinase RsbW
MSNGQISLQIAADLKELERVRHFVEEQATALGVEASAHYDVLLSVDEMVTNIIIHGYHGQPGTIELIMRPVGDALEVRLCDQAPPFDPTRVPAPDITLPLEQRQPGGMGIHMARHFMDIMTWRTTAQGGNELTLIKQAVIVP